MQLPHLIQAALLTTSTMASCTDNIPQHDWPKILAYNPPELPGTRHIWMWHDKERGERFIKFLNVPNEYEDRDVRHADYVGMFYTFNDRLPWLTIDDKRLFRTPDYDMITDDDVGPESPEDWPIMTPQELKEALGKQPSLEELEASFKEAVARNRAAREAQREGGMAGGQH